MLDDLSELVSYPPDPEMEFLSAQGCTGKQPHGIVIEFGLGSASLLTSIWQSQQPNLNLPPDHVYACCAHMATVQKSPPHAVLHGASLRC